LCLHAAALTSEGSSKGGPYYDRSDYGQPAIWRARNHDGGGSNIAWPFTANAAGRGEARLRFHRPDVAQNPGYNRFDTSSDQSPDRDFHPHPDFRRWGCVILGFVVSGRSPRTIAVRAVGPTLLGLGVPDAAHQPKAAGLPRRRPHGGKRRLGHREHGPLISAFSRAGLMQFANPRPRIPPCADLAPGVYMAQVRSADGGSGRALVEVYDIP